MTLEDLEIRKQQIEQGIINTNQSLFILQGHKQEVEFQIAELQKKLDETKVDEPSVDLNETEVE